jgi:hypothetical protein
VLCPGFVRTPIFDDGGKFGRMLVDVEPGSLMRMAERFKPIEPAFLAKKALDAVAKNKAVIIEPGSCKVMWLVNRLSQTLGLEIARKFFPAYPWAFSRERSTVLPYGFELSGFTL